MLSKVYEKSFALTGFKKFDIGKFESNLNRKKESYWKNSGQKNALNLFKQAAAKVPAYRDFLKKNRFDPSKVKTINDFAQLPETNKDNYIANYPLSMKCWKADLNASKWMASSSGTTGNPNYWPRQEAQEFEAAMVHEILLRRYFEIQNNTTLAIVGFPMGVYVSGMATSLPLFLLSHKYRLTILTAGNNKLEVLKAVKNLNKNFQQILLVGHPFFIKDILETGTAEGINWSKNKIGMMFCSEGFTEDWRSYILKTAGMNNEARAYSTYGSSEMLLMAYETPQSIRIRKFLEKNRSLSEAILGSSQVPNLFQYNPALRYIEQSNQELIFTVNAGLPLIRFNLHDRGKILPYESIHNLIDKASWGDSDWKLPFLALEGRSDYTIIFYAANIYPQHIHAALSHKDLLKKITGKFSMRKGYRKNMDEYLEINIELRQKISMSQKFAKQLQKIIFKKLKLINSEFLDASGRFGTKTLPLVKLWRYQHEKYFKLGLKPKYIQE